jgi:hypothetical protein
LINSNLKFNPVLKDRLFYNQFEYAVGFGLPEVNALRPKLTHESIEAVLSRRRLYWEKHRSIHKKETLANLFQFCDFLLDIEDEYKIVYYYGQWATLYTNNLALLDQIDALDYVTQKTYSQAVINRPKDTVLLKQSDHSRRSYFCEGAISEHDKQALTNFLINQKDHIRVSPGLQNWLRRGKIHDYVMHYFYIDHSDDQWITMLSLVRPGLIRKTMPILQDK